MQRLTTFRPRKNVPTGFLSYSVPPVSLLMRSTTFTFGNNGYLRVTRKRILPLLESQSVEKLVRKACDTIFP